MRAPANGIIIERNLALHEIVVDNTTNLFQPMRLVQKPDGSYINEGPLAGLRRFGDAERHLIRRHAL